MAVPLAERLHTVAIRVLRHVRADDVRAGLSAARLSALSVLVFGGSRTVSEMAEAEQVALPTMTKLLQGLERDGFLRRVRDRSDARVVRIHATAKGRRALERARDRRVQRTATLLAPLDTAEEALVAGALDVLERLLRQSS